MPRRATRRTPAMMSRARDESLVLARRKELGLHLKVVASRARCSAALLSMIEGGYRPKEPTMEKIAEALETTPQTLWPDEFDV
jgi:transcriptional regulator with XRE-family HTH domain